MGTDTLSNASPCRQAMLACDGPCHVPCLTSPPPALTLSPLHPFTLPRCCQAGDDFPALEKASLEMGRISDQLDALSDRWMELAELAGDL